MPVELPSDIAEEIANRLGIYGAAEVHDEGCTCRVCFGNFLTERMR